MKITQKEVSLIVDDSLMRVYVASPAVQGVYPGIVFYTDIYQLGGPMIRAANYLAGYGYVVAAPEIFHRTEPIGLVMEPTPLGKMRGNDNARRTPVPAYDADTRAVIDFLKGESSVDSDKLGALGFCIGGHLAFRAAFEQEIKASVCCYPTGVPKGKLGRGKADSIDRVSEIKGDMLLVIGTLDPHIPYDDRKVLLQSLEDAKVKHKTFICDNEHTFMRDDGYRYDPVASTEAWGEVIAFLKGIFN